MRFAVQRDRRQSLDIAEHRLVVGRKQRGEVQPPQIMRQAQFKGAPELLDRMIEALGGFVLQDQAVALLVGRPDLQIDQSEDRRGRHDRRECEGEGDPQRRGSQELKHRRSA